jgi:hypothetical protein
MTIHDIFYTYLIQKIAMSSLIEQIQFSQSSIMIDEEEEYEMNDILNNRYHYDKLQYKIVWIDHFSDKAWYSAENFEHFKNILKNYHQRYFEKLDSTLRMIVIIETMLSQWIKNEHKKTKQLIQNVLNKMKANMNHQKRFNKDSFEINVLARNESWVSVY